MSVQIQIQIQMQLRMQRQVRILIQIPLWIAEHQLPVMVWLSAWSWFSGQGFSMVARITEAETMHGL